MNTYTIKSPLWTQHQYANNPVLFSYKADMGKGYYLHVSQDWSTNGNGKWKYFCSGPWCMDNDIDVFTATKHFDSADEAKYEAHMHWIKWLCDDWLELND